ncbi:MAG: Rrf2 family transcriptional regulator [Bacteriovoracaceae bacterium]|jgi:Rrf2 family transcriptional regulator, nitric oxide-sensitive transcriptional repressor|nr:Rrf2 family transcriptional regulator [Bacteriovoracaceae bacterium]
MRLSQFSDYSIRTLLYLGSNTDRLSTVKEISEAYGISRNHLVKVVHNLSQMGVIETFKGSNGGIRLAADAENLKLGALLKKLEQDESAFVECFSDEGKCVINNVCKLKGILKHSYNLFFKDLDRYTLKDITCKKSTLMETFAQL